MGDMVRMIDMDNKTALITGASRGIGRATAALFAKNGFDVIINYKSHEKEALELASEIQMSGGRACVFAADVSKRIEVEAMFDFALKQFGKIDILVNNAGISQFKLFTDITEQEWNDMLSVNLTGMFNCCQCAVKDMLKRKNGNIINIVSMWGQTGASCEVHYSAAKGGAIALTKALAKELGPSGILVNAIAPGVIVSDMLKELDEQSLEELRISTPLSRLGEPLDVANSALFLASGASSYITGQVLGVNGGFLI